MNLSQRYARHITCDDIEICLRKLEVTERVKIKIFKIGDALFQGELGSIYGGPFAILRYGYEARVILEDQTVACAAGEVLPSLKRAKQSAALLLLQKLRDESVAAVHYVKVVYSACTYPHLDVHLRMVYVGE
jgi:hypothetical protein